MTQLAFSFAMLGFALVACDGSVEPVNDTQPETRDASAERCSVDPCEPFAHCPRPCDD